MQQADPHKVGYINDYCWRRVGNALRCDVDPAKGRVLCATQPYKRGSPLFVEPPLLLVAESSEDSSYLQLQRVAGQLNFVHAPLWYWAALCSLNSDDLVGCKLSIPNATKEQQKRLMLLCCPETHEASADVIALVGEFWPRAGDTQAVATKLERLLAVWLLNCFEHSEEPLGFSTFFLPSFLSHNCRPNCMWHYEHDDFVLRAREDIAAGDEITVSYLAEESLLESTEGRRAQLEATKHFTCHCQTCEAPLDASRGFRCLRCKDGEIFLCTDDDPATGGGLACSMCQQCGFRANAKQAANIRDQESQVEELVQEWDRKSACAGPDVYLTDSVALRIETNLASFFSLHHWLRDRASRHLITYYEAIGRADLALPLAAQCAEFTIETYPGCSALHAWALETQGDLRLRLEGFKISDPSGVEAPPGLAAERLAQVWREVGPVYMQATEVLATLFGGEHTFHTAMRDKYDALGRATRRSSGTRKSHKHRGSKRSVNAAAG